MRFRDLKYPTEEQALDKRISWDMYLPYDGARGTSPPTNGQFTMLNQNRPV